MSRAAIRISLCVVCVGAFAKGTWAQCEAIDFENLAVGTAVTTQYEGVTFSVVGQSCGGSPTLYMRIANSVDGHACSSRILMIDQGCPDFSSDYLRMVFDYPHRSVSFTLGPWYGTYQVRAYNAASGGSLIQLQTITLPGDGFVDVHRLVTINSAFVNIRRVEVQETNGLFEAIDNLAFPDETPPLVQITSPAGNDCACDIVEIEGIACEDDGIYEGDVLEYRRIYPDVVTDWTFADSATTPVCTEGTLYYWDTTAPAVVEGLYVLRITATDACGLSASAETTVYVDKDFDSLVLRAPAGGTILGGEVCLEGTAHDEFCFDHFTAEYRPAAGGEWQPVDPNHAEYDTQQVNDPFARWTAASGLADGSYQLMVRGYTDCGRTYTRVVTVTYDDTPPLAEITSPAACGRVSGDVSVLGTASDTNLLHWYLEWFDPALPGWRQIAESAASVTDGLLGTWHTAGLAPCYYAVRLRVYDQAVVDNCGAADHHEATYYLAVAVGDACPGDLDGDGKVGLSDLSILLTYYGLSCD